MTDIQLTRTSPCAALAGLAIVSLVAAAVFEETDRCFVGPVLGLSEKERPVACIFLGYSEQKTMAKRLPVERHTTWYTEA